MSSIQLASIAVTWQPVLLVVVTERFQEKRLGHFLSVRPDNPNDEIVRLTRRKKHKKA